jgi:hypothetical protein
MYTLVFICALIDKNDCNLIVGKLRKREKGTLRIYAIREMVGEN